MPLGVLSHRIPGSSHIVNEPHAFSAALYAFQFIVRYLLRCLFFVSVTPSVYGRRRGDLCNKATSKYLKTRIENVVMRISHNVIAIKIQL